METTIQNLIATLEQQEKDLKKTQGEIEETRKKLEKAQAELTKVKRCERCIHWNQHYRVEEKKGFVCVQKIYSGHCMPTGGRLRNRNPDQCCEHFEEKQRTQLERAKTLRCTSLCMLNVEE